jgi:hypothetical protein
MSAADPSPDDPQRAPRHEDPTTPGMSHPAARRRGRLLVPGVVLLGIVVVVLVIVLVGSLA